MRLGVAPDEQAYVGEVVEFRVRTFNQDDADGPQTGGVREPPRPPPDFDAGTLRLAS
jgi:hypothetical protein